MISMDKKYRTRDGREVRIYAVDHAAPLTVSGAIHSNIGWLNVHWRPNGMCSMHHETPSDLIEIRPRVKREVWLNVYPDPVLDFMHKDKKSADREAHPKRIACVKMTIDCEEGEGLTHE